MMMGGGSSAPTLDEINAKAAGLTVEEEDGEVKSITLNGKTYTNQADFKKDYAAEWAVMEAKAEELGDDEAKWEEFEGKYQELAAFLDALMELPETAPGGTSVTVDAAWDFTGNARVKTEGSPDADTPEDWIDGVTTCKGGTEVLTATELVTNKTGSGATLTVQTESGKAKVEWNGGLQVGAKGTFEKVAVLHVDGPCTVKFYCKGSSGEVKSTSSNINGFAINGSEKAKAEIKTELLTDYTTNPISHTCSAAGDYAITASGMLFTKIVCE